MIARQPLPILVAAAGFILAAALPCAAQTGQGTSFPVQNPALNAAGTVNMCLNWTGTAVPCSELSPMPVKIVTGPPASPWPPGSRVVTGIGTGTTGAVAASLAASSKLNYICGFDVSAIGGTATIGPITLAGLSGGNTFTYQAASTATGNLISRTFTPCIPASAVGTAITVTTTADGTATAVDVNVWGFQL